MTVTKKVKAKRKSDLKLEARTSGPKLRVEDQQAKESAGAVNPPPEFRHPKAARGL